MIPSLSPTLTFEDNDDSTPIVCYTDNSSPAHWERTSLYYIEYLFLHSISSLRIELLFVDEIDNFLALMNQTTGVLREMISTPRLMIQFTSTPEFESFLVDYPEFGRSTTLDFAVEDIPRSCANNCQRRYSPSSSIEGCKALQLFHHKSSMLIMLYKPSYLGCPSYMVHFYPPLD
ncbi:hypothetical protein Tco_1210452 [Tanacetum coccineum]